MTVCNHSRECLFWRIVDGTMQTNELGLEVEREWLRTASVRPGVNLDAFVIMPNHVHGVVVIPRRGVSQYAPTGSSAFRSPSLTIGAIIRGFKSAATKRVNELRGKPGLPLWQRSYYEHVVRDEEERTRIRIYIAGNPARWDEDEDNPVNVLSVGAGLKPAPPAVTQNVRGARKPGA